VHTSNKTCLTSVAIRIHDPVANRHQNLNICSLAHCQPFLKISCKSVQKFLHKVPNRQTNRQRQLHILPGRGKTKVPKMTRVTARAINSHGKMQFSKLNKIFNDLDHCVVSLTQMSLLSQMLSHDSTLIQRCSATQKSTTMMNAPNTLILQSQQQNLS